MRSQPPPQRHMHALPRRSGNASANYLYTPGSGYLRYVRAAIRQRNREGVRFVDNVCNRRIDLSTFIFDNYDASYRTRRVTNRPRMRGISKQGWF